MKLHDQFSINYFKTEKEMTLSSQFSSLETALGGHPFFNKDLVLVAVGRFADKSQLQIPNVALAREISASILKFAEYFCHQNNITSEIPSLTLRLVPYIKDSHVTFLFRAGAIGTLGRFNPELKNSDEVYYLGSGSESHDEYHRKILSGFDFVDLTTNGGLESYDNLINHSTKRLIAFDNIPKVLISNPNYLNAFEREFGEKSSIISAKLENFGKQLFYERLEFENVILRPATWVLNLNTLKSVIASALVRQSLSIPQNLNLNIYGGSIPLDLNDQKYCAKVIRYFIEKSNKLIDHLILEETMVQEGYSPALAFDDRQVASELVFGISF